MDDLALFREQLQAINNQPPPPLPQWFVDELREIGGINKYSEPIFRVVWGQSREAMDITRGQLMPKFKYLLGFYKQRFRRQAKGSSLCWTEEFRNAVGKPNYFIEEYVPPELIDREKWEHQWRRSFDSSPDAITGAILADTENPDDPRKNIIDVKEHLDNMGPYPERGMYLPYFMLHGAPCQRNLDEFREAVAIDRENRRKSSEQLVDDEVARQDAIWEMRRLDCERRIQDIFNTFQRQLAGNAVVPVATNNLAPLKGNDVNYIG